MRHTDRKKEKDKVAAMIMLCFCVIALTSIFTIKASIDKVSKSVGDLPVTQNTATEPLEEDLTDQPEEPDTTAEADNPEKGAADEAVEETTAGSAIVDSLDAPQNAVEYLCPMDMEIASVTKDFSMDMVVYNTTLDQYMTHPGIDIEGPAGSGVKAIADGTITDTYLDDAYGITIEITHANGLISVYRNLESDQLVEKGDTVTKGQHIANVGQSALYESMEKCHLHFEVYQDGELANPAEYVDFA